jgi:ketosteroid isomerase-like protein
MNTDTEELLYRDRLFSDASARFGAAEAFRKFLSPDSILLPDNGNPVSGIAAIYKSMTGMDGMKLTWEPQDGKVSQMADMGYTWGIYTITRKDGQEITGKYLNIWLKKDGEWKVEIDMGNDNPRPQERI